VRVESFKSVQRGWQGEREIHFKADSNQYNMKPLASKVGGFFDVQKAAYVPRGY
jgi:hypothetical protein